MTCPTNMLNAGCNKQIEFSTIKSIISTCSLPKVKLYTLQWGSPWQSNSLMKNFVSGMSNAIIKLDSSIHSHDGRLYNLSTCCRRWTWCTIGQMLVLMIWCVSWLGCFWSQVKYQATSRHISSKEACQPVHDGCGMNSCMSKSLYFVSLSNSDKYHVFSTSRYKNNAGYHGGYSQDPADKNKEEEGCKE